eukprot:NODE_899_length_3200_cov_0.194776.p2 type:complete len:256 gc:universal NODE_899_length_3200_cov_0.194776:1694-927(-)
MTLFDAMFWIMMIFAECQANVDYKLPLPVMEGLNSIEKLYKCPLEPDQFTLSEDGFEFVNEILGSDEINKLKGISDSLDVTNPFVFKCARVIEGILKEKWQLDLFCSRLFVFKMEKFAYSKPMHTDKFSSLMVNFAGIIRNFRDYLSEEEMQLYDDFRSNPDPLESITLWVNVGDGKITNFPLAFVSKRHSLDTAYYFEHMKRGHGVLFRDSNIHGAAGQNLNGDQSSRQAVSFVCSKLPTDVMEIAKKLIKAIY